MASVHALFQVGSDLSTKSVFTRRQTPAHPTGGTSSFPQSRVFTRVKGKDIIVMMAAKQSLSAHQRRCYSRFCGGRRTESCDGIHYLR